MSTRIDLEHLLGVLRHEAVGADGLRRTLAAVTAGRRRRPRYARLALAGAIVLCAALVLRQGRPSASSGPVVIPLLEQIAAAQERVTRVHMVMTMRESADPDAPFRRRETWLDGRLARIETPDEAEALSVFDGEFAWFYYPAENRVVKSVGDGLFGYQPSGFRISDLVRDQMHHGGMRDYSVDERARLDGRPAVKLVMRGAEPSGERRMTVWADPATMLPFRGTIELKPEDEWLVFGEMEVDYPAAIDPERFTFVPPPGVRIEPGQPVFAYAVTELPDSLTKPIATMELDGGAWWHVVDAALDGDGTVYLATLHSVGAGVGAVIAVRWHGQTVDLATAGHRRPEAPVELRTDDQQPFADLSWFVGRLAPEPAADTTNLELVIRLLGEPVRTRPGVLSRSVVEERIVPCPVRRSEGPPDWYLDFADEDRQRQPTATSAPQPEPQAKLPADWLPPLAVEESEQGGAAVLRAEVVETGEVCLAILAWGQVGNVISLADPGGRREFYVCIAEQGLRRDAAVARFAGDQPARLMSYRCSTGRAHTRPATELAVEVPVAGVNGQTDRDNRARFVLPRVPVVDQLPAWAATPGAASRPTDEAALEPGTGTPHPQPPAGALVR